MAQKKKKGFHELCARMLDNVKCIGKEVQKEITELIILREVGMMMGYI